MFTLVEPTGMFAYQYFCDSDWDAAVNLANLHNLFKVANIVLWLRGLETEWVEIQMSRGPIEAFKGCTCTLG